uniref:Protein ABHD14A n=1 Tax=Nothoprocta perdicaria TaxID=30464 RepID=A0A8C6YYM8_NOTPE
MEVGGFHRRRPAREAGLAGGRWRVEAVPELGDLLGAEAPGGCQPRAAPAPLTRAAAGRPAARGATRRACPGSRRARPDVLLLHGQAFTSKTWETLGTLALLAEEGYRAVAIDLPGHGDSPPSDAVATERGRVALLDHVLRELALRRPVLVSPSMSGRFAVPFLLARGARLAGFVPIAPAGTAEHPAQRYRQLQTPTLIVYGDGDAGLGPRALRRLRLLPRHRVAVLRGAGHACYVQRPRDFHSVLLAFLRQLGPRGTAVAPRPDPR